jgi:Tfp pilus assembly protein PilO
LCYIFYSQYIQPLSAEVTNLQRKHRNLKTDVQRGQIVQFRLAEFKKQVKQQEGKLAFLRSVLPEEKETAEIVRRVELLAREARLDLKSFTPQKTIRRDFYEDWPIHISCEGTYNKLGSFFEKVSQFTRIINVDNIAIARVPETQTRERTIVATCTATTFMFVEPVPVAEKAPKKGPARRTARSR